MKRNLENETEEKEKNNEISSQFSNQGKTILNDLQNIVDQEEELRSKLEKKFKFDQITAKKENEVRSALQDLNSLLSNSINQGSILQTSISKRKNYKSQGTNEKLKKPFKI